MFFTSSPPPKPLLPVKRRWIILCLRRPYSFCAGKKNMERKTGQKGAQKAPLWKHPRCGGKKCIVPHNQIRNLSVLASFSAQDAAAFWRLFGATEILPRNVFIHPAQGVGLVPSRNRKSPVGSGHCFRKQKRRTG